MVETPAAGTAARAADVGAAVAAGFLTNAAAPVVGTPVRPALEMVGLLTEDVETAERVGRDVVVVAVAAARVGAAELPIVGLLPIADIVVLAGAAEVADKVGREVVEVTVGREMVVVGFAGVVDAMVAVRCCLLT